MATYPQGVSTFIPDYQPYQPDFNFAANILQLKQTQYDQNWQRLNNIYGQILNAPLTHDESVNRRDNTLKRIDFDLKRITGLDLSLEQNVQQATQLFRPFYEDKSLMRDMVFTKNVGFERALGEGKRVSTDEKIYSQYWDGGLRAIDYKVQEFKETPYDQLTGFGDVKYTPYVNVEKEALDIASKLKLNIKRTTPQGDWIITEKNGEPAIPILQSVFYSVLGKDPRVKEVYATRAYLERKDYVMSNKDNPEFGGNAELTEKKYLNNTLSVLQNQTELIRGSLLSEKKVNDKMISKLEQSLIDGTDNSSTNETLQRYRDANDKLAEMIKQNENDMSLITDNVNRTLSTTGGAKLSTDDINQLRSRVDAVTASTLLQVDLDAAARSFAYINYEQTVDPNPFAVMKKKFLYDSSLIRQRTDAQKEVAYFKYLLDFDKKEEETKINNGTHYKDPKTGEVKPIPELNDVQSDPSAYSSTESADPRAMLDRTNDLYTQTANNTKTYILKTIDELNKEGVLSDRELYEILIGPGSKKSGLNFNMAPMMAWLQANEKKGAGSYEEDPAAYGALRQAGVYVTKLELEAGSPTVNLQNQITLENLADLSLIDLSPTQIAGISKRLNTVIEKKKDDPNIKNSSTIGGLVSSAHELEDYASVKKAYRAAKIEWATEVKDKLKADGFNYAEFFFDKDLNFVTSPEAFLENVAKWNPDHVIKDDAITFGGFMNTVMAAATAGAGYSMAVASPSGPGMAPAGVAGFGAGAVAGGAGYLGKGLFSYIKNYFSDGMSSYTLLTPSYGGWGEARTIEDEYNAMIDMYGQFVENSLLSSGVPASNHAVSDKELGFLDRFRNVTAGTVGRTLDTYGLGYREKGTGYYAGSGASIKIVPGLMTPTYNHFLEIKKTIRNITLDPSGDNAYVALSGPNTTKEDFGKDGVEGSIATNRFIFNTIIRDVFNKAGEKGMPAFNVSVTPFAGYDASKASITFKLPEDYLKQFAPTKSITKIEGLDEKAYQSILANGITFITDASKLQNLAMFRNSYKTPEQIRIEQAGDKGVTYTDPRYKDYSITYKTDMFNPNAYTVIKKYPVYNPTTNSMVIIDDVQNLKNMGTNIRQDRTQFFNEFAPQLEYSQNNERRQYERK
jgi:hypothetical protein